MKESLEALVSYFQEFSEDFSEILTELKQKSKTKPVAQLNAQQAKDLSLLNFLPYRLYQTKNCIFENDKTLGFVLRVSHFSGMDESAKQALRSIIANDLQSNCTLQVINYASPKIGYLLDYWKKSGNTDGVFQKISNKRYDFFAQGSLKSILGKRANLIVRDFELYFIFSMEKPATESAQQATILKLKALQDKFTHGLKGLNSESHVLNDRDLANLLQELLHPSSSLYKSRNTARHENFLEFFQSTYNVEMKVDKVTFSSADSEDSKNNENKNLKNSYIVFEVVDWPANWDLETGVDYVGDFEKGLSIGCPFYISMGYCLEGRESSQRTADKHRMIKTQQNDSKLPMFFPKMLEENNDWRYVSKMISQGERIGKLVMYIVLSIAEDFQEEQAEQALKDHFSRLGFTIEKVRHDTLNSFIYSLPFGIGENWQILDQLKISSKKLSGACTNLMPVFADSQNYTSPLMLLVGRRGQLFFFDNFKTADSTNGNFNMVVVGASGRGKSVWLQEYTISLLKNGGQVVIVDDGRSFKNTCELLDGDFVDFGGGNFCINPFSLYKDMDKNEDLNEYKENFEEPFIDLIVSILCIIINVDKNNTKDPEIGLYCSVLTNAVVEVMSKKGSKGGFSDVRKELLTNPSVKSEATEKIAGKIAYMLRSYSKKGRYSKYFNGVATLDIRNRFTVFELSDLENTPILQSSTLLTVTFLVYAKIRGRNTPTALIIDEFWRMGKHPVLKEPIGGFSRRGRKYNLSLIVASQCMSDFEASNSEAGSIALSQAEWRILLSVDGKDDVILKDELKMSSGEIEIAHGLAGMKGVYSEFMLRNKNKSWQIGRLLLDPFSAQIYSTKAEDVAAIKKMRQAGISVDTAIETLMKDKIS